MKIVLEEKRKERNSSSLNLLKSSFIIIIQWDQENKIINYYKKLTKKIEEIINYCNIEKEIFYALWANQDEFS